MGGVPDFSSSLFDLSMTSLPLAADRLIGGGGGGWRGQVPELQQQVVGQGGRARLVPRPKEGSEKIPAEGCARRRHPISRNNEAGGGASRRGGERSGCRSKPRCREGRQAGATNVTMRKKLCLEVQFHGCPPKEPPEELVV